MSNLNNYLGPINTLTQTQPERLVCAAEERYARILRRLAETVCAQVGNEIVMLAGPSASGKTTTALRLAREIRAMGRDAFVISLDNFYINQDRSPRLPDGTPDFETVHALDLPLIGETLERLRTDGRSEIPLFDFTTGRRLAQTQRIEMQRGDVIIVEGLHALNPLITRQLEGGPLCKLYVNVSSRIYDENGRVVLNKRSLRFVRRLIRDYHYRSSTVDRTFGLWEGVRRGEDLYLFPFKNCADQCINSVHLYEPGLFRQEAVSLLKEIDGDSIYAAQAQKLAGALERFVPVSYALVPEDSLLCEFFERT